MSKCEPTLIPFEFIIDKNGYLVANSLTKTIIKPNGIDALRKTEDFLRANFTIKDWQGVRIIFATAAAPYVPGEMLWLRDVGPSRSGKTEILRSIAQHKDSRQMEFLTPAAIRGGLKEKQTKLLAEVKGKRVITLDMAALLTTRKDLRNEVFGLLRLVKDGQIHSDFGSEEGHLEQQTKFDWILATTPHFEQHRVLESLLGERFIDLWWQPADREEVAIQAVTNNPELSQIRVELARLVGEMLDVAKQRSTAIHTDIIDNAWLGGIANITALLRSPVERDWKNNIIALPQPEYGTDIAQSFQKMALGLQLLRINEYQPYVKRLARDCVPSVRRAIISIIVNEPANQSNLASLINLPTSTVHYHLIDLQALGVVTKLGNTDTYRLKASIEDKIRSLWI